MADFDKIKKRIDNAVAMMNLKQYEPALDEFLQVRKLLKPPGVDYHIFLCLNSLGRVNAKMIPFLASALTVPEYAANAEMWRLLGYLYLKFEQDVDRGLGALRKAIELDPKLKSRFPSLNLVFRYENMKTSLKPGTYSTKVNRVDLKTGEIDIAFITR